MDPHCTLCLTVLSAKLVMCRTQKDKGPFMLNASHVLFILMMEDKKNDAGEIYSMSL